MKRHLLKSHPKVAGDEWQNHFRKLKGSEGQYKSSDNSLQLNAMSIGDSKVDANESNLTSVNGGDLKHKASEIVTRGEMTQEPTKRRKRVRESKGKGKMSILNDSKEDISKGMEGSSKRISYFPPISSNAPKLINRIDTATPSNGNKTMFIIEKTNSPNLEQNLLKKSQDFPLKLLKTHIDEKKVISMPKPFNNNSSALRNRIRDLPTHHKIAKRLNHVHNEFCGHVRVVHDDHIDYLVDGELHLVDHFGKVYPHKLGVSEMHPTDCKLVEGVNCKPIKERSVDSLDEFISAHVLLYFIL
jgi:hypothetical protein